MKLQRFVSRTNFIAISALSLCLGIPGQARAGGGCDGRNMIHRKPEDLVGYAKAFFGKFRHHNCQSANGSPRFTAPTSKSKAVVPADLTAPPAIEYQADTSSSGLSALPNAITVQAYEVFVKIPAATAQANGIVPGTFPAVLLSNEKKDGTWQRRHKMVAKVQEADGGYACRLVLRKPPATNSSVAIDFENGNSLLVASDLLAQGVGTKAQMPKTAKRKKYRALTASYPVRESVAVKAIRFIAPTLIHAGVGFMTMGPLGLIGAPISLASSTASARLFSNQQKMKELTNPPPLRVEYAIADQEGKIAALEHTIEQLSKRLDALQLTKQTTTEKK